MKTEPVSSLGIYHYGNYSVLQNNVLVLTWPEPKSTEAGTFGIRLGTTCVNARTSVDVHHLVLPALVELRQLPQLRTQPYAPQATGLCAQSTDQLRSRGGASTF